MKRRYTTPKRGFSLIELALALTILLIIIPTMIPIVENFMGDIQEQSLKQRILDIRRALQSFYLENGIYPNQLFDEFGNNVDFLHDDASELVNGTHNGYGTYPVNRRTYITGLPSDPITLHTDWNLIPIDNDLDGNINEDPKHFIFDTYMSHYSDMPPSTKMLKGVPQELYRGITTGTVRVGRFEVGDDDGDGRIDEDPIDVGDIKSRAAGFESL
jgi:prepilin-type N-terminal cleavage/methylation domain-containing protein